MFSYCENQWQVHVLFLATRNSLFSASRHWREREGDEREEGGELGRGEERLSDAGWHGNLAR